MLSGDIPSQHADPNHFAALDDRIQNAVEVKRPGIVLEAHANRPRPVSLLQKAAESRFYPFAAGVVNEVEELLSHDLSERQPYQLADALVDCAQRAVQRNRASRILERVDQLLEAALRPRNHLVELVELLLRGSRAYMFLQVLQQHLQLNHFLPPAIGIHSQQHGEQ